MAVTPVVDIYDGVNNRTWVNGNGNTGTQFPNFYSTGGTFTDYQNGENDFFNDISLTGTWNDASTTENDETALDWNFYSFTFTANSSDESVFISLLGSAISPGTSPGLALDSIKLNAIPEPTTGFLLIASGLMLTLHRRRQD